MLVSFNDLLSNVIASLLKSVLINFKKKFLLFVLLKKSDVVDFYQNARFSCNRQRISGLDRNQFQECKEANGNFFFLGIAVREII